jgi:hypothetical protein
VIRAGLVLLAWSALIGAWTVMLWIWSGQAVPVALFGAATVATALIGALAVAVGRRRPELGDTEPVGDVRAVPDLSLGTFALAIGVSIMAFGTVFGFFLVLIGGGLALAGLGRVLSERRQERRIAGRVL